MRVLLSRTRLNKPGSGKETWHIEFDLAESGLDYAVGDCFGIFPTNDPALVDAVIAALGAPPDFPIGGPHAARCADRRRLARHAPDMLFQLFSYITGGERRQKAQALASGDDPDGDAADARRARRDRKILRRRGPTRKPSSRRSIRCSRGSTRSRRRRRASRPRGAHRRYGALHSRPSARGSASPRPFSPTASRPATKVKVYVQQRAAFRAAGRSGGAGHHDRPGHRRRAVPRLPARAHGDQGAGPQLAVLRPPAPRLRFLLRGRVQRHEGRAAC